MKCMRCNMLLLLLFMAGLCKSQEAGFLIGVEGGAGLASLRGNFISQKYYSPRLGYSGGIFAQYDFKKIISLRSGVYYDLKGATIKTEVNDTRGITVPYRGTYNYKDITVPLLLRATLGRRLKYFINAGPYATLIMKSTLTSKVGNEPVFESDNTPFTQKWEFGVAGGIGISYQVKNFVLSLEARNNLGLTRVIKYYGYMNGVIKTNAANILVGVSYKLGKKKEEKTQDGKQDKG